MPTFSDIYNKNARPAYNSGTPGQYTGTEGIKDLQHWLKRDSSVEAAPSNKVVTFDIFGVQLVLVPWQVWQRAIQRTTGVRPTTPSATAKPASQQTGPERNAALWSMCFLRTVLVPISPLFPCLPLSSRLVFAVFCTASGAQEKQTPLT
ncbi:hypothetical protein ON010_g4425 [Phytophthora cinnamomi]|nr:hypothetical protein ON010_g4425 [Phytophthora cinnamomi]